MTDEKDVSFWNSSGPKKQVSTLAGAVSGVSALAFGAGVIASVASGAAITGLVWYGLKMFSKK